MGRKSTGWDAVSETDEKCSRCRQSGPTCDFTLAAFRDIHSANASIDPITISRPESHWKAAPHRDGSAIVKFVPFKRTRPVQLSPGQTGAIHPTASDENFALDVWCAAIIIVDQ